MKMTISDGEDDDNNHCSKGLQQREKEECRSDDIFSSSFSRPSFYHFPPLTLWLFFDLQVLFSPLFFLLFFRRRNTSERFEEKDILKKKIKNKS